MSFESGLVTEWMMSRPSGTQSRTPIECAPAASIRGPSSVAAGKSRNVHTGLQTLGYQRGFLGHRPSTPAGDTRDQLDPAILCRIVPVLMHGTITGITHSITREIRPRPLSCWLPNRAARWRTRIGYR